MTIDSLDQLLYTTEETAARLSLSPAMIEKLIRLGQLNSVRVGRSLRVTATEIIRYVNALQAASE